MNASGKFLYVSHTHNTAIVAVEFSPKYRQMMEWWSVLTSYKPVVPILLSEKVTDQHLNYNAAHKVQCFFKYYSYIYNVI